MMSKQEVMHPRLTDPVIRTLSNADTNVGGL